MGRSIKELINFKSPLTKILLAIIIASLIYFTSVKIGDYFFNKKINKIENENKELIKQSQFRDSILTYKLDSINKLNKKLDIDLLNKNKEIIFLNDKINMSYKNIYLLKIKLNEINKKIYTDSTILNYFYNRYGSN